jgi:hypothetical protein
MSKGQNLIYDFLGALLSSLEQPSWVSLPLNGRLCLISSVLQDASSTFGLLARISKIEEAPFARIQAILESPEEDGIKGNSKTLSFQRGLLALFNVG